MTRSSRSPSAPSARTSPPPPTLTCAQAAALRADLEDSGWGVETVAALLGPVAEAALDREIRLPALRVLHRTLKELGLAGAPDEVPQDALPGTGASAPEGSRGGPAPRARTAPGGRATSGGRVPDEVPGGSGTPGDAPGAQAGPGPAAAPTALLTALFMLGEPVPAAALDVALPRTGATGARATGLVDTPDAQGLVRPLVDLRPHEAVDDVGEVRWWVASDVGELVTGRELAPDHVLGIGRAGLTLAGLTPRRPVGRALDLGCGCGIQALYLLRHCEQVVATDVSARALAFTSFNAALAGVGPERLDLRQGSFLEPLAGERFDLIATNPPFVITPPAVRQAGLPLMEYRDAGAPVLPVLVPGLAGLLRGGGTLVMLGNWEHHAGQDWRERVSTWLPQDVDAWVVQRDLQDPVQYATTWLRDGGMTPERDLTGFEAALGAWVEDFEARGVKGVGLGYLVLHRPAPPGRAGAPGAAAAPVPPGLGGSAAAGAAGSASGATGAPGSTLASKPPGRRRPWRVLEEVGTRGSGALGSHVAEVIEVRDRLASMDDADVARLRPLTAPDVTEERYLTPGEAEPRLILLRQGGGLGRVVQAGTAMAALAGVADGELSVGQVAEAVAALTGADPQEVRTRMVADARELLGYGMLRLPS
ncbi:methyltransferase [uncultured Actinomyces sp.]|uniref:DUF7059 domain-containing protein n=1 Tax=uncultured Actinomyces sp. TaxID=249061 RepID=UPI0026192BF3|nr:methyltransferase [uncultured Actinomyces sp.]